MQYTHTSHISLDNDTLEQSTGYFIHSTWPDDKIVCQAAMHRKKITAAQKFKKMEPNGATQKSTDLKTYDATQKSTDLKTHDATQKSPDLKTHDATQKSPDLKTHD